MITDVVCASGQRTPPPPTYICFCFFHSVYIVPVTDFNPLPPFFATVVATPSTSSLEMDRHAQIAVGGIRGVVRRGEAHDQV